MPPAKVPLRTPAAIIEFQSFSVRYSVSTCIACSVLSCIAPIIPSAPIEPAILPALLRIAVASRVRAAIRPPTSFKPIDAPSVATLVGSTTEAKIESVITFQLL